MAGGTGGHVYPALSVARTLLARGCSVVWLGVPDSFEARVASAQGIPLETVHITGLRGKGVIGWLSAPWRLGWAIIDTARVFRRQRPDVALGMGGYASGPGAIVALFFRVPLVIHEQNAVAGLTNRWLEPFASRTLQAFPNTFARARTVGNPVRMGFDALPAPQTRMATQPKKLRLLVLGGSQGALTLNQRMPEALALLPPDQRPDVRHQGGKTVDTARAAYLSHGVSAEVTAFIDDMAGALGWADLAVCRAGASTVAELAAAGCPALLVPYPYAVDDHQTRNAAYLVDAGGAQLLQESDLTSSRLAAILSGLLSDRSRLLHMAAAARAVAWPDAAGMIASVCEEVAQ